MSSKAAAFGDDEFGSDGSLEGEGWDKEEVEDDFGEEELSDDAEGRGDETGRRTGSTL